MFWIPVNFSVQLLVSQWGLLHIEVVQFKTETTPKANLTDLHFLMQYIIYLMLTQVMEMTSFDFQTHLISKKMKRYSILFYISCNTRVGTLIVATIYLQLIQNRYMFRSFTVLHCSHQHCVQPVASDVEVVGYL